MIRVSREMTIKIIKKNFCAVSPHLSKTRENIAVSVSDPGQPSNAKKKKKKKKKKPATQVTNLVPRSQSVREYRNVLTVGDLGTRLAGDPSKHVNTSMRFVKKYMKSWPTCGKRPGHTVQVFNPGAHYSGSEPHE